MNHRLASALVFGCTVATATLGALVTTAARAETPTIATTPFGTLSRAQVRAELMRDRASVSSSGVEWALQQNGMEPMHSGLTRAQVQADYIRSRDDVHAMTSEDSGSTRLAQAAGSVHSGLTRAQARADYIRSRDEVHAMTSEDSGSARLAQAAAARKPSIEVASAREAR